MRHTKIILVTATIIGATVFATGCYKDKTVIVNPEITRTVTFSQDLIPIFSQNCALSGCHNAGGQAPNLTEANAYNSLKTGGYLDLGSAENSLIYLKMSGAKGTPMPVSGSNKDFNALVLAWIKQGANNN